MSERGGRRLLRLLVASAVVVAVALGCGVFFIVRYLRNLDDGVHEAWALFEADRREPEGRNGFAALWCLAYDVPEDEWETVFEEDNRREHARVFGSAEERARLEGVSKRVEEYPKLDRRDPSDPPGYDGEGFAQIRADAAAYARMYERDAPVLERQLRLADYDFIRNPLRRSFEFSASHSLFPLIRSATSRAHEFTSGDEEGAIDGACRDLFIARMLLRSGDALFTSTFAAKWSELNIRLVADMLAELPEGRRLPVTCADALAPPADEETSHCPELLREIEKLLALVDQLTPRSSRGEGFVGFDPQKTKSRLVAAYAGPCGDRARELLAEDRPTEFTGPPDWLFRLSCLTNGLGCSIEMQLLIERHAELGRKKQDVSAMLRMLGAIAWLRESTSGDEPWEARIAKLPGRFRTPARTIRLGEDGASIEMDQYAVANGGPLTLPLPATRSAQSP